MIDTTTLLTEITDPLDYCVHGTSRRAYQEIKEHGLSRMDRTHIHFASSPYSISGFRSSSEVLIHINMSKAMADGITFHRSGNGVILSTGDRNGIIHPSYFQLVQDVA